MSEKFRIIDPFIKEESEPFLEIDILETRLTPFTGSLIIHGNTSDKSIVTAKFSTLPGGAENEWLGQTTAFRAGVQSPKPIALIQDSTNRLGIVSRHIDGTDLMKTNEKKDFLDFGSIIKKMHSDIIVDGSIWNRLGKDNFIYYDKYINQWLNLINSGIINSPRVHELLKLYARALESRLPYVKPVFTHYDLHDGQVLKDVIVHKLHLIDFERWREGDPLDDIAIYLYHNLRMNRPQEFFIDFTRGYLSSKKFSDLEKGVINFFLLFTSFKSVDYYQRFRSKDLPVALTQLEKVEKYVSEEKLFKY